MSRRGQRSDADLHIRLDVANLRVTDADFVLDGRPYQRRYRWESAEPLAERHANVGALAHGCLRGRWNGAWPPTGQLFEMPLDEWRRLPCIEFRNRPRQLGEGEVAATAGCLDAILDLPGAPPEGVLAYARTWGPLGLCKHGYPAGHRPECESRWLRDSMTGATLCEPLGVWYAVAFSARHLLEAAVRFLLHEPLVRFFDVRKPGWQAPAPTTPDQLLWQRATLAHAINQWLDETGVRPRVMWHPEDQPRGDLAQPTLASTIAVQLAAAVLSPGGVRRCPGEGCGKPFTPQAHQPLNGKRRAYCPACRATGEAKRRWWRDTGAARRKSDSNSDSNLGEQPEHARDD
jgi:hypothetical protein